MSGQRKISSFFAPKQPSSTPARPKPTPSSIEKPVTSNEGGSDARSVARVNSQKRELPTDNDDSDDEDRTQPSPKKVKSMEVLTSSPAQTQASSATAARYSYKSSQDTPSSPIESSNDSPTRKQEKLKLREQFIRKLGRVSIKDHNAIAEEQAIGSGDEADEDEEESRPPPRKGGKRRKLTPLEQQVVDIKLKHPGTVLVVEVGYKYRFFGEDARIASQNLSIMCIPGKFRFDDHPSEAHYDKFASASIPTHRLHVHVKRLVANGYKVGVVRQLETAALKAAGDNKSGPFVRKLTNLYTKGTYVDDVDGLDGDISSGAGSGGAPNTGFLLCITEKPGGGSGTDEKAHVGIVAVQPSTGEVIYDEFDDGFMRSEIETRLLHIAPCEFLIVGELTKATEKLVSHLSGDTTTVLGDNARVERVERAKGAEAEAANHVSKFYADKVHSADSSDTAGKNKLLDTVLDLPGLVTVCLSAMIKHLSEYGLENVFDLTKYFQPFSARSHMLLNGNTLTSLEIYRNQTDYTTTGSLFWTLDKTRTKFGKRLLRNWVGRPLLDRNQLDQRIEAVEEIQAGRNPKIDRLKELLAKVSYDLEKGLIRVYYGKCTRPELLTILQTLNRIGTAFQPVDDPKEAGFKSMLLNSAVASLPGIKEPVEKFLAVFDHRAAAKDDKYLFFKDSEEYEAINDHKMGIVAVEGDLECYKKDIANTLKKRSVTYVTVSGVDYLIEVSKSEEKRVPADWLKMSATAKVSRYRPPQVTKSIRERDQYREALAAECDGAFKRFLITISTHYQSFRDCIHSLGTLDCLCSLAAVSFRPNYIKPVFTDSPTISIEEGRHPMVEQLLMSSYVPNTVNLGQKDAPRALLITGPNMGGKSSFVRQSALICIMAQIGCYVPASSATLGLLDAVYTRMGAFDNMLAGESTFMVELSETADILKQATPRSLVILDELGRGTSTHDGVAIAHAVMDYIVSHLGSLLLFVTHYPLLARFEKLYPGLVENAHVTFQETGEGGEEIVFLYKVGHGVAHRSYGLNVARLAGLPKSLLDRAREKSSELEWALKKREAVRLAKTVREAATADVEALLNGLEVA